MALISRLLIYCCLALTASLLNGQNVIQLEDGSVQCFCNPETTELLVWRDQNPLRGQELYGYYEKDSVSITFTPAIPFMKSGNYMAVCGNRVRVWTVPVPKDYEYGEVTAIYPTSSEIPANLLKFNIHFSKPMIGFAYDWISIFDDHGNEVDRAILHEIPELWNEDRTELSVWIEPGRTKRGLGPNEELGPVFSPGKNYELRISDDIRDREGVKLKTVFNKSFKVVEPDRIKPDFKEWNVEQVVVGSLVGIQINFDEVLDIGSASTAFSIHGVEGFWSMVPGEKSILFQPEEELSVGRYTIDINPNIEDLAGNNLVRLFDQEVSIAEDKEDKEYSLEIEIEE